MLSDDEIKEICDAHSYYGRNYARAIEAAVLAKLQAQSEPPLFPTMLRKMWSGREVQEWINENWKAAPVQQDQRPKLNLDRQQEPANPFAVFQIIQERNEARDMIRKVEELNAELEEQNKQLLEALKWALEWIDAVPKGTVLPTMPGFDRDYVDTLISKAGKQ